MARSSDNFSPLGKRLDSLRKKGEKKGDFAERIGVEASLFSKYLRGRTPDPDILLKIHEATNVSLHWLLTGRGPKFGDPRFSTVDLEAAVREEFLAKGQNPWPSPNEQAELINNLKPRSLGLKTSRPLDNKARAEMAASYLLEAELPKFDREALAELIKDAMNDPDLRSRIIEFYQFQKFKGGKKK